MTDLILPDSGQIPENYFDGAGKITSGELSALLTRTEQSISQLGALSDYIFIESLSDLPTPSGSVITLADNKIYQFNGAIALGGNRLVVGSGTVLTGSHNSHDSLIYTGSGAVVSAAGGDNLRVKELTIVALAGAMFDAVDAPLISIDRVFGSALRVGRFEDCNSVVFQRGAVVGLESGFELINATPGGLVAVLNSRLSQHVAATGALVDFGTSVWDQIQIIVIELISAVAGTDITGLSDNGNLSASGRARMFDSVVNGLGTHLTGITVDDVQWQFHNNTGLVNSAIVGAFSMTSNAVVTDIVTQNVFVKVAGTTVLDSSRRFDAGDPSDDNNLRVTALSPINVNINAAGSATKSGASKDYIFQTFKNGSPIGIEIPITVGNQLSLATYAFVTDANIGDEFDVRVANTEDEDDLTILSMTLSIIGF